MCGCRRGFGSHPEVMMFRTVTLIAALALVPQLALAGPRAPEKRITLDLYKADIINVIRLFGDVSGKNIVVGDDVQGEVTIRLKNVKWRTALKMILKLEGLGMEEQGGIIRIAPQATLDAEKKAALDAADQWRQKAPLRTKIVPVNYARAQEMVPHVKALLSERGSVTFDERTNVLIVRDVAGSPAFDL
jgi:type IV pilus assembly protein PilQ